MLRKALTLMMFVATGLYAWQPPLPVSLQIDAQNPKGFSRAIDVTVKVALRSDVVKYDISTGDVNLKIFLPPAMELIQGDLEWQGSLAAGEAKEFSVKVKPTINKALVWDIGAVLSSSLVERPLTDRVSIYIGQSRGTVLRNVGDQLIEVPWLKQALGYKEIIVVESGIEKNITALFVDQLQPQSDLDNMPIQQARPNKLYQQEWLDYLSPPEQNVNKLEEKTKQDFFPQPKLAVDYCSFYGWVRNSTHSGLYGIKVQLYMQGSPVATTYTVGTGYYSFDYECPPYPGAVAIRIEMTNQWGDKIRSRTSTAAYYTFDDSFTKDSNWDYNFGTTNFNDLFGDYDEAAECFYELRNISNLTRNSWGFSGIAAAQLVYPEIFSGTIVGGYDDDSLKIGIRDNYWSETSHEYGHHVHYQKGAPSQSSIYGKTCSTQDLTLDEVAYKEGWAEGYKDARYGTSRENETCAINTIRSVYKNRATIYDLRDNGNDGEQCSLTMNKLINGLGGNSSDILQYLARLKSQNTGDSTQINNVITVNTLYDQVLLAAAEQAVSLPSSFELTELAQNKPNPFNPSTTISYTISDEVDAEAVSLKVFDTRGRTVKTLVEGSRSPGEYTVFWDGTDEDGRKIASGVYFYRLSVGDFSQTRKMVIIK